MGALVQISSCNKIAVIKAGLVLRSSISYPTAAYLVSETFFSGLCKHPFNAEKLSWGRSLELRLEKRLLQIFHQR